MAYYRAVVVDKTGKQHVTELFAGCQEGAKKLLMVQFGQAKSKYSNPSKTDIVVKSITKIKLPE